MQRLLPPHLVLMLTLANLALAVGDVGPRIFAGSFRWIGLAVTAAGFALTLWGSRLFERAQTNIRTFNEPTLFVTAGPFRFTRNPMYLGFAIGLSGIAVAVDRWVGLLSPAVFVLVADRWYIEFEERRMAAKFGPDYADYRGRVRRWL